MHLRMTGTLLLDPTRAPRHARVRIDLGDHLLVFDDPRRFGTGELALGPEALAAFFDARLGVEPLERDFTGDHLYSLAQTSRAPVKAFLLDQKRVAGRREHLRRRGAVPRPCASAAAGQPPDPRAVRGDPRRRRRVAAGSASRPRARRSTTSATPTGSAAASRTSSWSTCASTSRARTAATRCASCAPRGRGTYVCERCQPRPRIARKRAEAYAPPGAGGARYAAAANSSRPPERSNATSSW